MRPTQYQGFHQMINPSQVKEHMKIGHKSPSTILKIWPYKKSESIKRENWLDTLNLTPSTLKKGVNS